MPVPMLYHPNADIFWMINLQTPRLIPLSPKWYYMVDAVWFPQTAWNDMLTFCQSSTFQNCLNHSSLPQTP